MSEQRPTRLVLVDDQAVVRSGLRMILETYPGLEVLADADDGVKAVDVVATHRPDVVLMDVRMPNRDGIEATRRILALPLPVPPAVLILTTFALEDHLFDALRAGAAGFVLKDAPPDELVIAIQAVARGDSYVTPGMTRHLIDAVTRSQQRPIDTPGLDSLTGREREVLALIGKGYGNSRIAETLVVEETTVKTHVRHILRKLELTSRVQAAVLANRIPGLVEDDAAA